MRRLPFIRFLLIVGLPPLIDEITLQGTYISSGQYVAEAPHTVGLKYSFEHDFVECIERDHYRAAAQVRRNRRHAKRVTSSAVNEKQISSRVNKLGCAHARRGLRTLAIHEDLIQPNPVPMAELQTDCKLTPTEFKYHSEQLKLAGLIEVSNRPDGAHYLNSPEGAGWLIKNKKND